MESGRPGGAALVQEQVLGVLGAVAAGPGASVTRRGAGLAMMVQAACGARPQRSQHLTDRTIKDLLAITQDEVRIHIS